MTYSNLEANLPMDLHFLQFLSFGLLDKQGYEEEADYCKDCVYQVGGAYAYAVSASENGEGPAN